MESKEILTSGILELYVAGALPEDKMREITRLVRTSPEVRTEVERLEAAFMAYATLHAPEVSEETKNAILRKNDLSGGASTTVGHPSASSGTPANTLSIRRWMALAASVLLLVSLAVNIYQYFSLRQTRTQLLALQAENEVYVDNFDALRARYDLTTQQFEALRNPETQSIVLSGTDVAPGAEAVVFWNPEGQEVYVDASALPEPPEGQVYQLWWLSSLEPLTPHDGGLLDQFAQNENKVFAPGKSIGQPVAFAITLEPAGGSTVPTLEQLYVLGTVG